MNNILAKIDSH